MRKTKLKRYLQLLLQFDANYAHLKIVILTKKPKNEKMILGTRNNQ
jgi:hypothetical protein